jgi:hypothetical protein
LLGIYGDFTISDSIANFVITDHDFTVTDITGSSTLSTATLTVTTATLTASATTVGSGWTTLHQTLVAPDQTWKFGADGALTLPGERTRIGNLNGADAIAASTGTQFAVYTQGSGGAVAIEWVDNKSSPTQIAGLLVNSPQAGTTGTVQIATGALSGQQIWTFNPDGSLSLPRGGAGAPGSGTIQILDTYPTLLAYGGGSHGGPELDWMNTDTLADFGSNTVLRNVMYINAEGMYVEMNANNVAGHAQASWSLNPDGTTVFPGGAGFVLGNSGQLKTNDGTTQSLDFRDTSGRGFYTDSSGVTLRGNGSYNLILGSNGTTQFPGNVRLDASNHLSGLNTVNFQGVYNNIGRQYSVNCDPGTATVIWTASAPVVTSMRVIVHAEVQRGSGTYYENFDTETTELLIAVRYENNLPTVARVAVIGAVSTLDTSLATYDVQINGSYLVELTCTPNPVVNERVITKVEYSESGSSSAEQYC